MHSSVALDIELRGGRCLSYVGREGTLDYYSLDVGSEIQQTTEKVHAAIELVKTLRSDQKVTRGTIDAIATTLKGNVGQQGTASEARFFERAARSPDRIVLNADIRDLGLAVLDANARAMERIANGEDVSMVARSATDDIARMKRDLQSNLRTYYRDKVLPEARKKLSTSNRMDDLRQLVREPEPLVLYGGDEVTISIPRFMEDLGLVTPLVEHGLARNPWTPGFTLHAHTPSGSGSPGSSAAESGCRSP